MKRGTFYPSLLVEPSRSAPLPLNFFLSHEVSFKNKHSPTRSFQTKTLTSWKVLGLLVIAQDLVYSIRHDRHTFPANAVVKTTGFPGCVRWLSHKEAAQLIRSPHLLHLICLLRTDPSLGLTPFSFISLVSVASNVWGTASDELYSTCSTRPKTSSNPVKNQANDEHTPRNIRGRYGDNTYCSSMAPEFVPFLRRILTGTTLRADVLLH